MIEITLVKLLTKDIEDRYRERDGIPTPLKSFFLNNLNKKWISVLCVKISFSSDFEVEIEFT